MNQSLNTPADGNAETLATQFQVSELEPRLENLWGAIDGPEQPNPNVPEQN